MMPESLKKHIRKLHQKKYREEYQEFFVEGQKGVEEILESSCEIKHVILSDAVSDRDTHNILKICKKKSLPIVFCTQKEGNAISATESFPGTLAVAHQQKCSLENFPADRPIIVLDQIADPGNLGTIIRTADWFGGVSIILSENCVDPYNPKVVRSTMGSLFRQKIYQSKNIVQDMDQLHSNGYSIAGLSMEGEPISNIDNNKKTVYIFGSESHGIRQELRELVSQLYSIPGGKRAESLNVAIACSILLYEIY